MLYIFDEIESLDDDFPEEMISLLSDERRDKVKRHRYKTGKKSSAVVYLLLRLGLLEEYGINEAVVFDYLEKGKPVLRYHPKIHFSLSHSNNAAACVVADSEVGVDVQNIREVTDNAAKRALTIAEYDIFKNHKDPYEYFCEIWAVKESVYKKTGQGIAADFREVSANEVIDKLVIRNKDYYCCVCGEFAQKIQVKYIGREDFGKLLSR